MTTQDDSNVTADPHSSIPLDDEAEVASQPPQVRLVDSAATDCGAKNKKKGQGAKKKRTKAIKSRGTGFEDYFCDAPITPEEATTEKNIYDPVVPFVERIETCVQRYRARRRLDNERGHVLSTYLMLGGIDTTQRQFQGSTQLAKDAYDDMDADEIRQMRANDVIDHTNRDSRWYHPSDPTGWQVNWTAVVSGFVSERLMRLVGSDSVAAINGLNVILNFLNYVVYHQVCPEYLDDINSARQVCYAAAQELPAIKTLHSLLPGSFSTAARTLFCKRSDSGDFETWDNAVDTMDAQVARHIYFACLLAMTPDPASVANLETTYLADTVTQIFEIVEITDPTPAMRDGMARVKNPIGVSGALRPCGFIRCRPSHVEDGKVRRHKRARGIQDREDFLLEEHLLDLLRPGMKACLVVSTLNMGLKFIRDVREIWPTFHTFLPQELMLEYKEPRLRERKPPSADDGGGVDFGDDDTFE